MLFKFILFWLSTFTSTFNDQLMYWWRNYADIELLDSALLYFCWLSVQKKKILKTIHHTIFFLLSSDSCNSSSQCLRHSRFKKCCWGDHSPACGVVNAFSAAPSAQLVSPEFISDTTCRQTKQHFSLKNIKYYTVFKIKLPVFAFSLHRTSLKRVTWGGC